MTPTELLQKFSRTTPVPTGIVLEVATIRWISSYEPITEWETAEILPKDANEAVIIAAQKKLLKNPKFFATCHECHEHNPIGWMHSKTLCQGCASANHGIVY